MKSRGERMYSPEQLKDMVKKMRAVSGSFYPAACATGNHAFIEFCGFMNEYIKIFEESIEAGEDPTTSNIHMGSFTLLMEHWHAAYIAEKFECIFGIAFANKPEAIKVFCDEVFGKGVVKVDMAAAKRRLEKLKAKV